MGLVDYSDSDVSDVEEAQAVKPAANPAKPAFQKVVDRSNPGKIRVSLPQASSKDNDRSDEPPAKRAKTGGGTFSGFNSFLPAPKRTAQSGATLGVTSTRKNGLGAGINLKTGAAPGFSRTPIPDPEPKQDDANDPESQQTTTSGLASGLTLPPPKATLNDGAQKPAEEIKLVGKPLMFRPLSVTRKPAKKKAAGQISATPTASPVVPQQTETPAQRPKVSLFSMETERMNTATPSNAEYKPMMFETPEQPTQDDEDSYNLEPTYEDFTPNASQISLPPAVPTPPVSQSLDDIAGDLKLSAAERRQLFGRQKGGRGNKSATKIINFNTDEEYLHNEELRASGEQISHNPVRSIAPGKHSLKQLVNAAQSQKEALEESFAKGKNNRAEAGSRYGW